MQDGVEDKIADVSEAAQDKVEKAINDVNEILPVIQELGYTVDGVNIAIGIIPDITIDISGLAKTIEDTKYQQILEEHKGHTLRISVVKALQTMSSMHQKIRFGQMESDNASITLGLPPKITLKFKKNT